MDGHTPTRPPVLKSRGYGPVYYPHRLPWQGMAAQFKVTGSLKRKSYEPWRRSSVQFGELHI